MIVNKYYICGYSQFDVFNNIISNIYFIRVKMKENRETNDTELSAALNNVATLNMFSEETRSIIFWRYFTIILLWIL